MAIGQDLRELKWEGFWAMFCLVTIWWKGREEEKTCCVFKSWVAKAGSQALSWAQPNHSLGTAARCSVAAARTQQSCPCKTRQRYSLGQAGDEDTFLCLTRFYILTHTHAQCWQKGVCLIRCCEVMELDNAAKPESYNGKENVLIKQTNCWSLLLSPWQRAL